MRISPPGAAAERIFSVAGPVHAEADGKKTGYPGRAGTALPGSDGSVCGPAPPGVGPRQIDETELEDLFAMLGGNDDAGAPLATIDAIMGG